MGKCTAASSETRSKREKTSVPVGLGGLMMLRSCLTKRGREICQRRLLTTPAPFESRPPLPAFTFETAMMKVRMAEDAWNSRNPKRVALAYSEDSKWRNRSEFITGREEIEAFLTRKWSKETEYRLIKELFSFHGNRIAVRFAYEWFDQNEKQWFRSYGNENWEFDDLGYMARRYASINDLPIADSERKFHWPQGRRPIEYPNLSELGL